MPGAVHQPLLSELCAAQPATGDPVPALVAPAIAGGVTSPPGASLPAQCAPFPGRPAGGDRRLFAPLPLSVVPRPGRSFHAATSHALARALAPPALLVPTLPAQPPIAARLSLPVAARFAGVLAPAVYLPPFCSNH